MGLYGRFWGSAKSCSVLVLLLSEKIQIELPLVSDRNSLGGRVCYHDTYQGGNDLFNFNIQSQIIEAQTCDETWP